MGGFGAQCRETRADVLHEGTGPAEVGLGILRQAEIGEHRSGEAAVMVEVAARDIAWPGLL